MRHSKLFGIALICSLILSGCNGGTSGFDPIPGEGAVIDDVRRGGECQQHRNLTICRIAETPDPSPPAVTSTPTSTPTSTATPTFTDPGTFPSPPPPSAPTSTHTPTAPPTATPVQPTPGPMVPVIGVDVLGAIVPTVCFSVGDVVRCEFDLSFVAANFLGAPGFRLAGRAVDANGPWILSETAALGGTGGEDDDGDGLPNCIDPCRDDPTDACADPCLLDSDADGTVDCIDPCPGDPRGADDLDADGLPNCVDPCPLDAVNACMDICARDSDGDGFDDCTDICPFDHGVVPDADGDGLFDCIDPCPLSNAPVCDEARDRDEDGIPDFEDFCPVDPEDLCFDGCGADFDGDGAPFCVDPCPADPLDLCQNPCAQDADADGINDCEDPCPFAAEFAATTTIDVPLQRPTDRVLIELAVLVFAEPQLQVPEEVDDLFESGAILAFVSEVIEVVTLDP